MRSSDTILAPLPRSLPNNPESMTSNKVYQQRLLDGLTMQSMSLAMIYSGIAGVMGLLAMFVHYRVMPYGSLFDGWPLAMTVFWVAAVAVATLFFSASVCLMVVRLGLVNNAHQPGVLREYWQTLCDFYSGLVWWMWVSCVSISLGMAYYLPEAILGSLTLVSYWCFKGVIGYRLRRLGQAFEPIPHD